MSSSRAMHRVTAAHLGMLNPLRTSSQFNCCGGPPLGWNIDTGEVITIDPQRWKYHGHIAAPIALAFGKIGFGKTSLAKVLAMRLSTLKAGNGERPRVALDDTRRNDGELEYERLAKFMGGEETALRSLNMLDPLMGMNRPQNLDMLIDVGAQIHGSKLDHYDTIALQVALNMTLDYYPKTATLEQLLAVLMAQRVDDVETYVRRHQGSVLSQQAMLTDAPAAEWDMDLTARLKEGTLRINEQAHRQACHKLLFTFQRLLSGGDMSGVFGGNDSLSGAMSQRVVAFDYSALPDNLISLVQSLIWRWKGAAQRDPNSPYKFHIEIHDENHKLWKDLQYAKAMSAYMKIIRTTSAFLILNSHRDGDYEAIAGEQGLLANNALNEVDILFLGRQAPPVAKSVGARFDLGAKMISRMPTLEVGEFIMVIGMGSPPIVVKTYLTPLEMQICETNQSNKRALES
jgi:hypothetical protein